MRYITFIERGCKFHIKRKTGSDVQIRRVTGSKIVILRETGYYIYYNRGIQREHKQIYNFEQFVRICRVARTGGPADLQEAACCCLFSLLHLALAPG